MRLEKLDEEFGNQLRERHDLFEEVNQKNGGKPFIVPKFYTAENIEDITTNSPNIEEPHYIGFNAVFKSMTTSSKMEKVPRRSAWDFKQIISYSEYESTTYNLVVQDNLKRNMDIYFRSPPLELAAKQAEALRDGFRVSIIGAYGFNDREVAKPNLLYKQYPDHNDEREFLEQLKEIGTFNLVVEHEKMYAFSIVPNPPDFDDEQIWDPIAPELSYA